MSTIEHSQEATPVPTPVDSGEVTPSNPNNNRKKLIFAGVGVAALAAITFGGIAAANSHQAEPSPIENSDPNVGETDDILENPVVDGGAEEAVDTPEVAEASNNTLTNEQILEILVKCPSVSEFYPNATELIKGFSEAEAQATYKIVQDSPEAGQELLMATLAHYSNQ